MLSSKQNPGYLRQAKNLLPLADGGMQTRPGARQLLAGSVTDVVPWGDRLVLERNSRVQVFQTDGSVTDVDQAGRFLLGTNYQALTANALREDRLYIADGIRPLWFLALRNGVIVSEAVENAVLDGNSDPYAIPTPTAITTWRGRLWIAYGSNRVQHCQHDDPDYWDPLWTVECQGKKQDRVISLEPFDDTLVCGLSQSMWSITGESHLNFKRRQVSPAGCAGPLSLATDGQRVFRVSKEGVFSLSESDSLAADVVDLFGVMMNTASLVIDQRRKLLLCVVRGRLLAIHLDTRKVGEVSGFPVVGVFEWDGEIGWYGADGVWMWTDDDLPDQLADGSPQNFDWLFETWPDQPNLAGDGRAFLSRALLKANGSSRGGLTYAVNADRADVFSESVSLIDESVDSWADVVDGVSGENYDPEPVRREFVPMVSGEKFRHSLSGSAHAKIVSFVPEYQGGV